MLLCMLFLHSAKLKKGGYILKLPVIITINGITSVVLGLTYITGIYGQVESEVAYWGIVSITIGLFLVVGLKKIHSKKIIFVFVNLLLAAIQVIPIMLWFEYQGRAITDPTPGSSFNAHWLFSFPHIIVLLLSCITVVSLTLMFYKPKG